MKEKKADRVALVIIDLVMQSIPMELLLHQKTESVKKLSDELVKAYRSTKDIILES